MKKLLSIVLATALSCSLISCNDSNTIKVNEIGYKNSSDPIFDVDSYTKIEEKIANQLKSSYPNDEVEYQKIEGNSKEYTKYLYSFYVNTDVISNDEIRARINIINAELKPYAQKKEATQQILVQIKTNQDIHVLDYTTKDIDETYDGYIYMTDSSFIDSFKR